MSIKVHIEHNPFTIETIFLIDGQATAENTFERYKTTRLQLWIEHLFTDLEEYFNGVKDFEITFKGVEADWLDLVSAMDDASSRGFNINRTHISTRESSERLADIQALMEEATNHPVFGEEIRNNKKIQRDFVEANNRDFDVYVAATMSAGKSTFINAMLGYELLPAANEATTATIATITDNDNYKVGEFRGQRINKDDDVVDAEEHVTLTTMQEWNGKEDTKLIELEGNIINIKERNDVRLKITDTPGPNNSQDPEHARVTMRHIGDSVRNPLIIYLLNGTQLGVKDDQAVLTDIATIMEKGGKQNKDRFIFVANKMDEFDPDKGETIDKVLINIRNYLKDNGIENPQVYPISAISALLHRKNIHGFELSKKENRNLGNYVDLFSDPEDKDDTLVDFVEHMPLTQTAKSDLKNKKLVNIEYRSGVAAIEYMIDKYIVKYNVPNRVNRAYQALTTAIERTTNEAERIKAIQKYETEVETLKEEIKLLKNNRSRAMNLENEVKQELSERKETFIIKNLIQTNAIETKIRQRINEFSRVFKGTVSKSQADSELKNLKTEVTREYNLIITELESLHSEAQKNMRIQLSEIFHNRVQKELTSLKQLPQPVLEGIKHQFEALEQFSDLGLIDDEIESKEVKIGTHTIKTSKWYKPWTWGDSKEEAIYDTKQEVNLVAIWKKRELQIRNNFNSLISVSSQKLEKDTDTSATQFAKFMSVEFTKHTDFIYGNMLSATDNKKQLEKECIEAEKDLEKIKDFKKRLDAVLAL